MNQDAYTTPPEEDLAKLYDWICSTVRDPIEVDGLAVMASTGITVYLAQIGGHRFIINNHDFGIPTTFEQCKKFMMQHRIRAVEQFYEITQEIQ